MASGIKDHPCSYLHKGIETFEDTEIEKTFDPEILYSFYKGTFKVHLLKSNQKKTWTQAAFQTVLENMRSENMQQIYKGNTHPEV